MRPKESFPQKLLCALIVAVTLSFAVFVTCLSVKREPTENGAARAVGSMVLRGGMGASR